MLIAHDPVGVREREVDSKPAPVLAGGGPPVFDFTDVGTGFDVGRVQDSDGEVEGGGADARDKAPWLGKQDHNVVAADGGA
eukprot:4585933-Lingulodinium_polyedra.AAC.1